MSLESEVNLSDNISLVRQNIRSAALKAGRNAAGCYKDR